MPTVEIKMLPGVIKDQTELVSENRYVDADKMRFRRIGNSASLPEVIGGFEDLGDDIFEGKGRALHAYKTLDGDRVIALGTTTRLYGYVGNVLHDVTPIRIAGSLSNALDTNNGSPIVSVTHTTHGLSKGDRVYLKSGAAVGGITLGSSGSVTNGLQASTNTNSLVLSITGHGLNTGDLLTISSGVGFAGIPAAEINREHSVYKVNDDQLLIASNTKATSDATYSGTFSYSAKRGYNVTDVTSVNVYTITFTSNANATVSGAGGSLEYSYNYSSGEENTSSQAGYSTGTYSEGSYSLPSSQDYAASRARVWTLSHFQGQLVANYNNSPIFTWDNCGSHRAVRVKDSATDCPDAITFMTTPENFIVAFGGANNIYDPTANTSTPGTANPLRVQWASIDSGLSDVVGPNVQYNWTPQQTNSSGDFILAEGNEIVAGAAMSAVSLIWTDTSCYQIQFVPELSTVFRPTLLASGAGLASKNAWARAGSSQVFWLSSSREFMVWQPGGVPTQISCPMRDFFFDNLAEGQLDLVNAGTNDTYNECTWWFPTSETNDIARYITYNFAEQCWYLGTETITAWQQRGVQERPISAHVDGTLRIQEIGHTGNGNAFNAFLETGWLDLEDGHNHVFLKRYIPDWKDLAGGCNLKVKYKMNPQASTVFEKDLGAITSTTEKIDTRIAARMLKFIFTFNSNPTQGRIGRLLVDLERSARTR